VASYFQGSNATLTVQWYEFAGGPPANVTAQTVTIIRVAGAVVVVGPTAVGITQLATGLYTFTWAVSPTEVPGDYAVVWNATDAALDPVQTSEVVTVLNSASAADGPCLWEIDTACCQTYWDTLTPALQASATAYATLALWAATGRQYGMCPITVRPCGRYCNDSGYAGQYWADGTWIPYILGGVWRNCWCGCGGGSCCTCAPTCQVYLPGPVSSIVSVTVDGAVVDPATYRVDNDAWLVRTGGDGFCWPDCQDFDLDSGVGTFFVTYTRGPAPPAALLSAAGTLACEFAKACQGQACRLPAYVVALSRQGVDFQAVDPTTLLELGLTGLWEVDSLIRHLNPYAMTHRPRLVTPDLTPPRITTFP
jgi:hypothetical protein